MAAAARLSVIVPAHDEAAIISANVARMIDGDDDRIDLVVVANGCADATAETARAVSDRIRVIEIAATSKIAALRAGDEAARHPIRAFVDADVAVTAATLHALADVLAEPDGPLAAAPRLVVDASRSSLPARQYFRVWEHSDYRRPGHIGSGIYALSERGRARLGGFPDVVADDRWVELNFGPHERATIDADFTVPAPRTLRAQVRRAIRIQAGNRELAERFPELQVESRGSGVRHLLRRVAARPRLWAAFPAYAAGYLAPRFARASAGPIAWNRDETSRV